MNSRHVTVHIPESWKNSLAIIAREAGTTQANIGRIAIKNFLGGKSKSECIASVKTALSLEG